MKSNLPQEEHLAETSARSPFVHSSDKNVDKVKKFSSPFILPNRMISHHPKAGVNLIVDAASYLFSVMGKLKQFKSYKQLGKLQAELIQEINIFFDTIQNYKYGSECVVVCRYVLCAALDEIILNTPWGRGWIDYSLLTAFNQDTQHQDKFFSILERIIKDPEIYIDLMELMYLCLSMGYKGHYRTTEHDQHHLEQITNHLYKHIRAYRGNFSKVLSPPSSSTNLAPRLLQKKPSYLFLFLLTACVIMTIFISLGYIMDIISNESQNFTPLSNTDTR